MSDNRKKDDGPFLQYDAQGFILSLKNASDDVSKIDKNVEVIRDILIGLHKEIENQYTRSENQPRPKLNALEQALIDAQIKPADFADLIREQANPLVQSSLALDRVAKSIEDLISESLSSDSTRTQTSNPKPKRSRRTIDINSTEDVIREFGNTSERERDANGRFVGANTEQSTLGKVAQTIGTAIKGIIPSNPQGVDPTLDAINEVANVLSPVKRAAGFMLRPLTGWMKSRKRNEPIPKEQSDHNRRQVKLLQRIADNLQSRGGLLSGLGKLLGAGGGLLGSLFGGLLGKGKGLGKGLSKILKFGKGLPIVGALLTAMSFSDWGSQTTKEKGGTVGSLAGGLAGGALGSILGPVGTIAGAAIGSWVGDKLGGVVAPYVKEWTDSLIDADIPTMISKLVSLALKLTPGGLVATGAKSIYDWFKEKSGGGFNPSTLLRSQYGGQGVNESNPVQFGAAAKQTYATGKYAPLLDEIARGESKHGGAFGTFGYDTVYSGAKVKPPKPISQMTIGEVKAYQQQLINSGSNSSPVGRYQFIKNGDAFAKQVAKAGLKDTDIFNAENQDRLAIHYAGGKKQVDEWIKNRDFTALTNKTAQQWAGLKNSRGVGNYDNDGLNKASAGGVDAIKNASEQILKNESNKSVETTQNIKESTSAKTAETIMQRAKKNVPVLNMQSSVTPVTSRTNSLGASYNPPKTETNVQLAKEFLTSPAPQEVVVKNQNSGTINQNVSNRLLAHAITGGLGMGDRWNG
jgi:hypothetical protein